MKQVKAIFMDSEGTLRNKNNKVNDETINIISALEAKGVPVIITTGLPRFISKKIALKANATSYLVSSNGADIYDLKKNQSIKNLYLNKDFINKIYNENKEKYNIILGVGDFEYSNSQNEYNLNTYPINNIDEIKENFFQCHISQKNMDLDELLKLRKNIELNNYFLKDILGELFNKYLNFEYGLTKKELTIIARAISFQKLLTLKNQILEYKNLVSLGNQSLDFTKFQFEGETPWFSFNKFGVSKGNAISVVCDYLKINQEDTIAIGNDYNDRTMIDAVGKFYCPNNARDFIKTKTDNIYMEDDIGKVLKKTYERL